MNSIGRLLPIKTGPVISETEMKPMYKLFNWKRNYHDHGVSCVSFMWEKLWQSKEMFNDFKDKCKPHVYASHICLLYEQIRWLWLSVMDNKNENVKALRALCVDFVTGKIHSRGWKHHYNRLSTSFANQVVHEKIQMSIVDALGALDQHCSNFVLILAIRNI